MSFPISSQSNRDTAHLEDGLCDADEGVPEVETLLVAGDGPAAGGQVGDAGDRPPVTAVRPLSGGTVAAVSLANSSVIR